MSLSCLSIWLVVTIKERKNLSSCKCLIVSQYGKLVKKKNFVFQFASVLQFRWCHFCFHVSACKTLCLNQESACPQRGLATKIVLFSQANWACFSHVFLLLTKKKSHVFLLGSVYSFDKVLSSFVDTSFAVKLKFWCTTAYSVVGIKRENASFLTSRNNISS